MYAMNTVEHANESGSLNVCVGRDCGYQCMDGNTKRPGHKWHNVRRRLERNDDQV